MGCQSSLVPYEHRDYDEKNDSDIPFDFDGKNPQLGNGASGTVYKVKGVSSPFKDVKAARKVISLTAPTTKQRARKEAEAINKARHGHVVRLFMTYFYKAGNKVDFVIIMDRADGSLQDYLTGEDPRLRDQWFGCLIGAVAHIHRRGIRHRDIKPTNVLVKHKRVLLADFGISAMGLGKTIPTTVLDMARARTPEYCSPDVQDGHTRGRSADIFSLGAVFLEMLIACSSPDQFRELPVGSGNDKSYAKNIDMIRTWMDKTKQGFHTVDWHATLFSLCREMLDPDRYRRPQAKDLQSGWSGLASSNESLKCPTCAEGHPVSDSDKLITACEEGPADEVKRLLQRGADPNSAGAIHQASSYDQRDIVVTLLNYGADVNVCDLGEQIALHYAA
ncbi:kinase-like protein, partial [Lentithecium fluviatile CBS 122367]